MEADNEQVSELPSEQRSKEKSEQHSEPDSTTKCDGANQYPVPTLPPGYSYFHDGIDWVSNMMEIDDSDADWFEDAEFICKAITEIMEQKDSIYKFVLKHLLSTATFSRGNRSDLPFAFEQYLHFTMPFPVTPIFNNTHPTYVHLYTNAVHPMISNSYINPEAVQLLLRGNLHDTIEQLSFIECDSGIQYKMSYRTNEIGEQGFMHEILAFENREFGMPSIISFVFLPAIEFSCQDYPLPQHVVTGPVWPHCGNYFYWLALLQLYPRYDGRSFCPYIPRMQKVDDERMVKYRNALRLLIGLRIGNNIPNTSDIFVLKGLHFYRLRYNLTCDCNLSLGTVFMELLNVHADIIYFDAIQKYITFGEFAEQWMHDALKLDSISRNISMFYYLNNVPLDQLKVLFGML